MISAKATRPTSQSSQTTHEDYAEPEQPKRAIVPVVFLLFLTGCAAYLKSFLPVRSETTRPDEDKPPVKEAEVAPKNEDITGSLPESDGASDPMDAMAMSSGNVIPIRFALSQGSIDPRFPTIPLVSQPAPFAPQLAAGSAGENIRPFDARPSSGGGGSGGGGGGGSSGGGGGGGARDDFALRPPNGRDFSGQPRPGPRDVPSGREPDTRDPATPARPDANPNGPGGESIRNRPPRVSGPVYLADVIGCNAVFLSVALLLAGATDADGDTLRVVGVSSSSGTISRDADGNWLFARDPGMLGDVTLKYAISDGTHIIQQTAHFRVVEAPPIIGTAGDDNLLGTHCSDTIDGAAGDDNIDAREGNDTIYGGEGNDHIVAGSGNDTVYAGPGNDLVFAGLGNDVVFGGAGNDRLFGEAGNDTLLGEEGDDYLNGGAGADILLGRIGTDYLVGDEGDDSLDGGDGDDQVFGGLGRDIIVGGSGNDFLSGGDGSDVISDGGGSDIIRGDGGNDHLIAAMDAADDDADGGAGIDTLDYSAATTSVEVRLEDETAKGSEIGNDAVTGFERVIGGSGDDRLSAGTTSASLNGAAGHDTIIGGPGGDSLHGGEGDDVIADAGGSDTVHGDDGDDRVIAALGDMNDDYDGGEGHDTLDYSAATTSITVSLEHETAEGDEIGSDRVANFERIASGSGDDRLSAGSDGASLDGGAGDDVIEGGAGDDTLDGGDGDDVIADGAGSDHVQGGEGDDCVTAAADAADDDYDGGNGNDRLDYSVATLSIRVDLSSGSAEGAEIGRDLIANFEQIIGGSGNDSFIAGSSSVSMTGGSGNNSYEFRRDDDDHQPDVIYKITDFNVGDRIFAATYEIYYRNEDDAEDEVADLFKDIYLSNGDDRRPIRFRFEEQDEKDVTVIDVHDRPDNDHDFFSIQLSGYHQLQFTLGS